MMPLQHEHATPSRQLTPFGIATQLEYAIHTRFNKLFGMVNVIKYHNLYKWHSGRQTHYIELIDSTYFIILFYYLKAMHT